jgi:hypothetical protein
MKCLWIILSAFLVLAPVCSQAANTKGWLGVTTGKGIRTGAPGLMLKPSTEPTHADLGEGVLWAKDSDNKLYYYNGSSSVDLTVQAGGSLTLDGAFDNGKIINGANSAGNAMQVGDGTDAILMHTEAAGDVRITTNGTSDLTIAPDGGDTDITGTLDLSGAFSSGGDVTITGDADITVTDTSGNGVYIDGSTITTGDALQIEVDAATMAGGLIVNLTQDTVSKFSVNEDGNTIVAGTLNVTGLSTLGSATVSTGGLTIASGGLTVTGDVSFTASTAAGNAQYIDGTTVTTGDVLQIEYDATNLNTGLAINVTEDGATVLQVAEDGNTTIAGTAAGTDALAITAGDLTMSSGRFDISGDAGSADLVDITRSNTATGGDAIDIDMGSAAQAGDGVDIAWAGAGTGDAITINMANNVTGAAINIAASGARTGPIIDIANAGTDAGTDDHVVNILQSGSQDSNIVNLAFGTANSPGNAISIDMDTNLAGEGLYIDEGGTARTGSAIEINADGTGTHSVIDMNISGNAAITGIDIDGTFNGSPAGNALDINLDDGDNLDTGLIALNAGTGNRGALIKYTSTGTDSGTTSHVIDINQTGQLDSNIIDITYDTGVSTGQAVDINMGSNVAGMAVSIDSAATGVDNEGSGIDINATGALVQGANVFRIDSAGNMAHSDTRVVEITEAGADQASSYTMAITSTNNGGIILSSGATDHAIDITQGIVDMNGNKIEFFDAAVGMYSQADTYLDIFADGALRIGDSSGGAPTNYTNIASNGTITFVGTARLTKKTWIGSESFKNQANATEGVVAAGFKHSWEMTDGADDYITTSWYIPDNWVSGTDITAIVHWSSPATTLVGVWDLHYVSLAEGEDTTGAGTNLADINDTSNGTADYTNRTTVFTIANGDIAAGDMIILRPGRVGTAGADTLADIADFHGLELSYTANKP